MVLDPVILRSLVDSYCYTITSTKCKKQQPDQLSQSILQPLCCSRLTISLPSQDSAPSPSLESAVQTSSYFPNYITYCFINLCGIVPIRPQLWLALVWINRFKYRTEPVLSPSLSDFWCWRQLANCQRVIVQEIECMICNVTLQPLCKFVIAKLFSIVFNLRVSAFICWW